MITWCGKEFVQMRPDPSCELHNHHALVSYPCLREKGHAGDCDSPRAQEKREEGEFRAEYIKEQV